MVGYPAIDFTETHQVIIEVGYGQGPELARRLEDNNVVCNYQAAPDEEGFTASGALRLGTSEMTRFGMGPADFAELAGLIAAVIDESATVKDKVRELRGRFLSMRYCFQEQDYPEAAERLRGLF